MARFIAILLIFIPGALGAFGIKLMRDALFADVYPLLVNETLQFIVGLILFIFGFGFVGGFIFHRDKKRNRLNKYNENN